MEAEMLVMKLLLAFELICAAGAVYLALKAQFARSI